MFAITILGVTAVAAPALLCCGFGLWSLTGRQLGERVAAIAVQATIGVGLGATIGVLVAMLARGDRHIAVALGDWVAVPHYHFTLRFVFDRLSIPFLILSYALCGTIGAFAARYLHREPGFPRFFVLYALFLLGIVTASVAGTIETLFAGWELVGLSSALLVAFFQERTAPVRNGLRVWTVYRLSDAALLAATLLLHRMVGEGNFDRMLGEGPWPLGEAAVTPNQALLVGLLLLVAAAGKSALIPLSGWLPRAMEGPTPSSAVFYGALSVHLGAFLLLRVSPLLILSPGLCMTITVLGLATALFAAHAGRVQTDVKSALSFASLTQVGLIVAEIGALPALFGPYAAYIPLTHLLGHACLRTLQFVRAPNLLQDYRLLENALGDRLPHVARPTTIRPPGKVQRALYRFALERGRLDVWLDVCLVAPFFRIFRTCDQIERRWTDLLTGGRSRESDRVRPAAGLLEDVS